LTDYKPISCRYHDILESIAVMGETCYLVYDDETGNRKEVRSKIRDVFARSGEEFLKLDDGTEVRLDRLKLINETWVGTAGSTGSNP